MIPLFVKQMNTQRKLQELQPKLLKVRERYKNDKQRLQQEQIKIYQESGTNPLMGCLPLLLQMPVFFALFNVLRQIAEGEAKFGFTQELANSAQSALIFGAPIAAHFTSSADELAAFGADPIMAKVIIAVACVIMGTTTFLTMRQSMSRTLKQPGMEDNPMVQSQKIMMYIAPAFGLFGLAMPVGVLIYWVTSNLWTMGQQHFLYRKFPPVASDGGEKNKAGSLCDGQTRDRLSVVSSLRNRNSLRSNVSSRRGSQGPRGPAGSRSGGSPRDPCTSLPLRGCVGESP